MTEQSRFGKLEIWIFWILWRGIQEWYGIWLFLLTRDY